MLHKNNIYSKFIKKLYSNKDENRKNNNIYKYHIKFSRNKKRNRINCILKITIFVVIAAFTGAISGIYTVNKMYLNKKIYASNSYYDICDLYKNTINSINMTIQPFLVRIYDEDMNEYGNSKCNKLGIIISSDGYIIISAALLNDKHDITIKLYNGDLYKADIVGKDKLSNLAVIKIDKKNLKSAKLANSSKIKAGDMAFSIGNPLGQQSSLPITMRIINGVSDKVFQHNEQSSEDIIYKVVEVEGGIDYKNIGGAICDSKGNIIGVNSYINFDNENANKKVYIIASNEVKKIMDSLLEQEYVLRTLMGIYGGNAVPVDNNGVEGIYVQQVVKGSGAEKAKIRPTDIIVEMNNIRTYKIEKLNDILKYNKSGDIVQCKIWRNGEFFDVDVTLSEIN